MRRLALLIVALAVMLTVTIPSTVKRVYADAPCSGADIANVVYDDWYKTTYVNVYDVNPGVWRTVRGDLKAFRLFVNGACHRAYYASAWLPDGSGAYFTAHMRVWIGPGGNPSQEFDSGTIWATRADTISSGWVAADWTNYIPACPASPACTPGPGRNYDFGNYHDQNWLPRADNYTTYVRSPTWQGFAYSCAPGENGCNPNFFINF